MPRRSGHIVRVEIGDVGGGPVPGDGERRGAIPTGMGRTPADGAYADPMRWTKEFKGGGFRGRVNVIADSSGRVQLDGQAVSPHLLAAAMTAKLYVAGAENDASFDNDQFERLSSALLAAGVDHELVTYPASHGFAVPDNPTYDVAAATRHWQALESLYASALTTA